MKLGWNALTLRIILSVLILLLIVGGIGVFILGKNILTAQADEADELSLQANASRQEREKLARTKTELEKHRSAIKRASQIVAESKSYMYQNQITQDLYQIAAKTGISINGITFDAAGSGSSGAGTPAAGAAAPAAPAGAAAAPAAGAEGAAAAPAPAAGAAPGVTPTNISITLNGPTSYEAIVSFVYMIEQNLTKMRVSNVALSAATGENGGSGVTSDAITIEVYLRQ